jgi:hypothetical protein
MSSQRGSVNANTVHSRTKMTSSGVCAARGLGFGFVGTSCACSLRVGWFVRYVTELLELAFPKKAPEECCSHLFITVVYAIKSVSIRTHAAQHLSTVQRRHTYSHLTSSTAAYIYIHTYIHIYGNLCLSSPNLFNGNLMHQQAA